MATSHAAFHSPPFDSTEDTEGVVEVEEEAEEEAEEMETEAEAEAAAEAAAEVASHPQRKLASASAA